MKLEQIYDKTERKFAEICIKRKQILIHSNRDQDIYEHWDWKITNPKTNQISLVDVKGARKKSRSDISPNYDITWLELMNVRGSVGWLKGKADFIAFEQEDHFLLVKRLDLLNWIKGKITNKEIVRHTNQALYRWYRRLGRKDIITLVNISDIKANVKFWKLA